MLVPQRPESYEGLINIEEGLGIDQIQAAWMAAMVVFGFPWALWLRPHAGVKYFPVTISFLASDKFSNILDSLSVK